jgi:glutamate-ammonia-ligase adenylyltransferase
MDVEPLVAELPEPLRGGVREWLAGRPGIETSTGAEMLRDLPRVVGCSSYAADVIARYPEAWQTLVDSGRLERALAAREADELFSAGVMPGLSEAECQAQLRRLRHRELLRIVWRDLTGRADVTETLGELSAVADAAIRAALAWSEASLASVYGNPMEADGDPARFVILGMGKLGGRELNFSSDIDLVFLYTDQGDTNGPRSVSNEQYFRQLGQRIIGLLSKQTADGFAYRVDVRLRPFGDSGPLAVSLPALETYLVRHGRDWERYAYVKARVINEWDGAADLDAEILRPFIYRRYLDYGVFSSLRDMKALIEAEVQRREYLDNIKLGPGGIREIEFIVQSLQLVRGGTIAELRERELLTVLPRLVRHGCLPADAAAELRTAYLFLRRVENRLQAIADRQTHDLPGGELNRTRLALACGADSWAALSAAVDEQRTLVSRHFRGIVFRGTGDPGADVESTALAAAWTDSVEEARAAALLENSGFQDGAATLAELARFRDSGMYRRMDEAGRQRLDALMPALLAVAGRQSDPARALSGAMQVMAAIGRRSAYFALLIENPSALQRLVQLCGMSDFLVRQVASHPLLLDELLDPQVFGELPAGEKLRSDLEERLLAAGTDDPERRLYALGNFQQAAIFRVAVADLSGNLPLMKVSDRLTEIAELVLQAALDDAWVELTARHGTPRCRVDGKTRPARFGIVGYGKLGGLELGYGSDLDLVFLHDSAGESQETDGDQPLDNTVFFGRLTRRIIHVLTLATTSGRLYEVDTRLRPSGKSGLLVSSLAAFDRYQQDDAWTWEHQALLRSRAVAGPVELRDAFESLRQRVLREYVHRERLREDVVDMRQRMRAELSKGTPELFDLKQDPGGIADIEFIVQYMVLRDVDRFPGLAEYSDNIRQLDALAANGLLTGADATMLADTYREYRERMHRLALVSSPALVPRGEYADSAARVTALWDRVLGAGD